MKRLLPLFVLTGIVSVQATAQNWTWMRGSSTSSVAGNYGTMGTPAPTNDPGARHGAASWTDLAGNLWLFGGEGYSTNTSVCWLNDLWKYDKSSNQWTWIRGSNGPNAAGVYGTMGTPSPLNDPGAREFMISWTDATGKFWLFGGEGFDGSSGFGNLADLWRYDPGTNQWTWMKGFNTADQNGVYGTIGVPAPSNLPGGRHGSGYWTDPSDNLWLFGGEGFPSTGPDGFLNDLWKFDPATNNWTWMKGSDQILQTGTYGTFSVTSATNLPGGRGFPTCWFSNGQAYMFGGVGHATVTLNSYLNDLWRYNPTTNNWTWISGLNGGNQNGQYGTVQQSSPSVYPGSRHSPASWLDPLGRLWLFGGLGIPGQGSPGNLNDLFRYDPANGQWAWMKGDTAVNLPGSYGTMGVAAPSNKPGARQYNTWWKGTGSEFWLVGGLGRDDTTLVLDNMNDLWLYSSPCNPDSIVSSLGGKVCTGTSATLSLVPPDASAISWYSSPTGTAVIGTGSVFVTNTLVAGSSAVTMTFFAGAATCSQSPRTVVTVTVYPHPLLSISAPTAGCQGSVVSFSASGAQNYSWTGGAAGPVATATLSGMSFSTVVTGLDAFGCEGTASHTMVVNSNPVVTGTVSTSSPCAGDAVSFSAGGASSYSWSSGHTTSSFTAVVSSSGQYSVTGFNASGCHATTALSMSVQLCTSAEHPGRESAIYVYPNPSQGSFRFSSNADLPGKTVRLYNALGELVAEIPFDSGNEINTGLPKGIYYCTMGSPDTNGKAVKLVIQ